MDLILNNFIHSNLFKHINNQNLLLLERISSFTTRLLTKTFVCPVKILVLQNLSTYLTIINNIEMLGMYRLYVEFDCLGPGECFATDQAVIILAQVDS